MCFVLIDGFCSKVLIYALRYPVLLCDRWQMSWVFW